MWSAIPEYGHPRDYLPLLLWRRHTPCSPPEPVGEAKEESTHRNTEVQLGMRNRHNGAASQCANGVHGEEGEVKTDEGKPEVPDAHAALSNILPNHFGETGAVDARKNSEISTSNKT